MLAFLFFLFFFFFSLSEKSLFSSVFRWSLIGEVLFCKSRFFFKVNQPETGVLTKKQKKKMAYLREMSVLAWALPYPLQKQNLEFDSSWCSTGCFRLENGGFIAMKNLCSDYLFSGKGVAPSRTPWCSSYQKWSLQVTLNYGYKINKYLIKYLIA